MLAVGFVVLVGGGIWLANAMVDARKADECISSGRRNCIPIEVPLAAMIRTRVPTEIVK